MSMTERFCVVFRVLFAFESLNHIDVKLRNLNYSLVYSKHIYSLTISTNTKNSLIQ